MCARAMCVRTRVCMNVCMCARLYVCMCPRVYSRARVSVYVCARVCMCIREGVLRAPGCLCVRACVCMYVPACVCARVCMCACVYVRGRMAVYLLAVDLAVGQHHGLVVLVERLARDAAEQARVRAVRVRQRAGQLAERRLAGGAAGLLRGLRVAVRRVERGQPELQRDRQQRQLAGVQQPRVLPPELRDQRLPPPRAQQRPVRLHLCRTQTQPIVSYNTDTTIEAPFEVMIAQW